MKLKALAAALGLAVVAHGAQAGLVVFTGQQGDGASAPSDPANAAFTSFSSALSSNSLKTENLETYPKDAGVALPLMFGGNPLSDDPLATISGGGDKTVIGRDSGRHSIGGGNVYWQAGDTFTITFTNAVSAFGLWFSDLGDFDDPLNPGGALTVTLKNGNITLDCNGARSAGNSCTIGGGSEANEIFWGVVLTPNDKITSIEFSRTNAGFDGLGVDQFSIGAVRDGFTGPPDNPVPEPGSLALFGLALAGLTRFRRR